MERTDKYTEMKREMLLQMKELRDSKNSEIESLKHENSKMKQKLHDLDGPLKKEADDQKSKVENNVKIQEKCKKFLKKYKTRNKEKSVGDVLPGFQVRYAKYLKLNEMDPNLNSEMDASQPENCGKCDDLQRKVEELEREKSAERSKLPHSVVNNHVVSPQHSPANSVSGSSFGSFRTNFNPMRLAIRHEAKRCVTDGDDVCVITSDEDDEDDTQTKNSEPRGVANQNDAKFHRMLDHLNHNGLV